MNISNPYVGERRAGHASGLPLPGRLGRAWSDTAEIR